ncbi:MAG TPA: hypothetical protein VMU03_13975 [Gammaproteobacteria bacterium]|nr:hypothetical protein [Gammaproteobacteria bacterium]
MARRRSRAAPQAWSELRERLAQEAARVMAEGGIEDFGLAKRKAADRLGVRGLSALPTNAEIESRLVERLRIFEPEGFSERLSSLRRLAADVMLDLEPFAPRLVGPVLAGTVTVNSGIELHVFAAAPELVAAALERDRGGLRDCQRRYRLDADTTVLLPGFSFTRAGEEIEVIVFPERAEHQAPLSPVDRKPMRRATRSAVLALLEA